MGMHKTVVSYVKVSCNNVLAKTQLPCIHLFYMYFICLEAVPEIKLILKTLPSLFGRNKVPLTFLNLI